MFKLITIPGEEVIHVIPQEYTVDGEDGIEDPIGMAGVKLEANFHVITAQVGAVRNIIKCVERSGLNPKDLVLEPFASALATLDKDELQEGVALVDIGGGTTDVAIFLGLSALSKKRIGLKKIPPPIPTMPDTIPKIDPIKKEIMKLSFLTLISFFSQDLLFIINKRPAIDKTINNRISNISLLIIKVPPKNENGIDPIKKGISSLIL